MKNIFKIKIHSFVDLITNSSTEIFVRADEKTIQTVKDLIDTLLKLGNSNLKADDLFEFQLVLDGYDFIKDEDGNTEYIENVNLLVDPRRNKIMEQIEDDYESHCSITLYIKAKDEKNNDAKLIAEILNKLENLLNPTAYTNY